MLSKTPSRMFCDWSSCWLDSAIIISLFWDCRLRAHVAVRQAVTGPAVVVREMFMCMSNADAKRKRQILNLGGGLKPFCRNGPRWAPRVTWRLLQHHCRRGDLLPECSLCAILFDTMVGVDVEVMLSSSRRWCFLLAWFQWRFPQEKAVDV